MMKNVYLIILLGLLIACNANEDLIDYDLVKHGLSIKIKTPADPEVQVTDLGIAKDVTVKKGEDFNIQILSSKALTYDSKKMISDKKEEVENGPFFSKIISEDDIGFIFEKKIDEETINYDFRAVKIVGDIEYVFQSGLMGRFSLENIEKMYSAIK